MKTKMFSILTLGVVFALSGCSEEKVSPPESYLGNKIESGISWIIPDWRGGEFTLSLKEMFVRWAGITEWKYRVLYDGEEIDTGVVSGTELKFSIPKNYSGDWRKVVVEGLLPEKTGGESKWTLLASSEQNPVLVEVNGVLWSKSNLILENGAFSFANSPEELGLYFKHMSCYGVLSEGDSYSGKCYTPEEKTVALADIPEKDGDPCMKASGGVLRLPSRYEIEKLFDAFDEDVITINGVKGMSFDHGKLFLPFAGGYNMYMGDIAYKNISGSYWYSGENTDGSGGILAYVTSENWGLMMSYGEGEYTGSVRCVRNIDKPAYVSHSPVNPANSAESEIQVVTTPGDMDEYSVTLMDGSYEIVSMATSQMPTAKIIIPENPNISEIVYTLFVNGEPTGKTITQPGISNYGFYKSHKPTGTVPAAAFTLTVNCTTDMDALDVEVKDGAGLSLKAVASKASPSVEIAVPENTGNADRVLKIYVNGKDTNRSVIQERPLAFVVIWSPGYLTVKDGAYAFAGEQELGMYFKYKSRYGLTLDPTGKKYSGTAYGPAAETKAYTDVNYDDVDPCTLVAPAGTWRMPSREEWDDMLTYDYQWLMDKYRVYTDKKQSVYITSSGSITATGTSVTQPQWAKVWSTTPHVTDPTKYYMLVGTFSTETGVFSTTSSSSRDLALMVRCVRDR